MEIEWDHDDLQKAKELSAHPLFHCIEKPDYGDNEEDWTTFDCWWESDELTRMQDSPLLVVDADYLMQGGFSSCSSMTNIARRGLTHVFAIIGDEPISDFAKRSVEGILELFGVQLVFVGANDFDEIPADADLCIHTEFFNSVDDSMIEYSHELLAHFGVIGGCDE